MQHPYEITLRDSRGDSLEYPLTLTFLMPSLPVEGHRFRHQKWELKVTRVIVELPKLEEDMFWATKAEVWVSPANYPALPRKRRLP